eukprot:TRINITY_DN319_c0_g2_i1.p1 TRINITY_DN319_c0_g2~~TRINITY_DN319_c0_g2_i1.p1  ORF type:complete len:264 (+),score=148.88 TRINITY_DN319_c0_g2_i1:50-841(+)
MENVNYVFETLQKETLRLQDNFDFEGFFNELKNDELVFYSALFLVSKFIVPFFRLPEGVRKGVLNPILMIYNLGMVIFSAWAFVEMLQALQVIELYTNDCTMAFKNAQFERAAKFFYYSKFIEYFDSWSLALAGKPVSFLQSFHHFGAPIDMFVFYHAKNEAIWIFVLLNSFVHTIMYAYYLATLFKIKIAMKPLITVMQITQFNLGFYLVWKYKDVECFYNSPERMFGWLFNYFYVGMVLTLFLNFFLKTYLTAKPKKEKKA